MLLHFFEGKMIDVIRQHFEKADLDSEEMLPNFASEFGIFHQQKKRFATQKIHLYQRGNCSYESAF